MQSVGVLLLLVSSIYSVYSATIGKKIPVPDSNPTLQDLVYRSAVPNANQQIGDSMWWIPTENKYQASKISVPTGGKTYSTYSFSYTLQRSTCSSQQTAISALRSCKLDKNSSRKVKCSAVLAWMDNDWSSIEIENRCSK